MMLTRGLLRSCFVMLAVLCITCTAPGCTGGTPPRTFDAAAVDDVMVPTLLRHDRYVKADASLSTTEKDTYLRSSSLIQGVQDTAMGRVSPNVSARGPPLQ